MVLELSFRNLVHRAIQFVLASYPCVLLAISMKLLGLAGLGALLALIVAKRSGE